MKNLKKLFASVASIAILASVVPVSVLGAASYSDELQEAYDYAYNVGITTQSSIDAANMYGTLTRAHMAKMMVNFAKEVFNQEPDTDKECNFTDLAGQTQEMKDYIEESCQLGLMGVGITAFNPNGAVTRAQFGTVLSRVLRGDENEWGDTYYSKHLAALKEAGIMNNISNPMANEIRGYVMLMMMRADNDAETPAICETPENQTACSLGLDTCPEECVDDEEEVVANGNLEVSLASSEWGDVPYGISSLPVATYKFTADEDVTLNSIVAKRLGYFDDDTVKHAALFINGGRVSKVANFSSTTDEVTLNLTNGYDIKAGDDVEIAIHVDILNSSAANGEQFSVDLLSVDSTAEDVDMDSDLTSETFKIINKATPTITLDDGSSVENPKLGEKAVELFDFTIDNASANDQDVQLNSITFKENGGTIDEEDELENFELVVDWETVAEVEKMDWKYLAFNIEDGYVVREGKKPTFTVKADVIGGAGKTIDFTIENAMDVVALWDKYDKQVNVAFSSYDTDTVTVAAGKVTLERVNASDTDLIRNRNNLFLGSFKITNSAGWDLTLQDLKLDFTGGAALLTGILETVKIKLGSTNASPIELTSNANASQWSETSIEKSIGSSLMVYVYADTLDNSMDGLTLRMSMSKANLVIEESTDDTVIAQNDISPATLTWTQMNGKDAELTLSKVALSNKTVAEGTEGVEALKFKIKAGTAYGTLLKKITFTSSGTVDSDTVNNAVLYKGTTPVDAEVRNGSIVIEDDITISKWETAEFTLKVDVQSNPEVTGFMYILDGANIDAEDTSEDANEISITDVIQGRQITVTSAGEIVAAYESQKDNNKYTKNILGGNTAVVAEYSLYSKYEAVNVGKAIVTFSANDTDTSLLDVELVYNGETVASNPTWDANGAIATFDDIDFDTLTEEKPLLVRAISKVIDEDGGATLASTYVTKVDLQTLKWKDSWDDLVNVAINDDAKVFGVVPATIFTSVKNAAGTNADLDLLVSRGENTTSSNVAAKANLEALVFAVEGNNGSLTKVTVKDDAGTVLWSGTITTDGDYTVALTKEAAAGTTTLKVSLTQSGAIDNPSYSISIKEVQYETNVNVWTNLTDRAGVTKTIISK